MLRTLLAHADDDPQTAALARDGGGAFVSQSLRPYLIAALLDRDPRPPGDRRRRRRPRRARSGRRPADAGWRRARSATTRAAASPTSRTWRRRRTSSGCGSPRSTRCSSADAERRRARSSSSARSRCRRRCPTRRCARTAFALRSRRADRPRRDRAGPRRGRLRARRPGRGPRPVRDPRRPARPVPGDRGPRRARRPVRRRDRVAALVLDVHPALAGRRRAWSRWRPPPSSPPSTASWPRSPRSRTQADRPDIAELLPVEDFHPFLELVAADADGADRRRGGGRAGAGRPLAGRHRRVPRRRRPPPVRRARRDRRRRSTRAPGSGCRASTRTSRSRSAPRPPTSPPAGLKEAEPELEKLTRSGYRTVVAFAAPRRGRAGRLQPRAAEGPLARRGRRPAPAASRADHVRPGAAARAASSRRSSTSR